MMLLDLPTTVALTQRLLGAGLLLQSAEVFVTRRSYGRDGFLPGRAVTPLLVARGALALGLLLAPRAVSSALLAGGLGLLLLSSAWMTVRMRGPLCGGSDSMLFQVQLGLFIAALAGANPHWSRIGLGWIAAQSVLSYFLAGIAKLKNVGWRDGQALQSLFASAGPYVLLAATRAWAPLCGWCAALGWGVVGFELVFPVILILPPEGKLALLVVGFLFHVANAVVLGLNRFIWAWLATYPALLYFA